VQVVGADAAELQHSDTEHETDSLAENMGEAWETGAADNAVALRR
jgi:hypothetical protein